jgi:DNA-binding NtrC family response regulator
MQRRKQTTGADQRQAKVLIVDDQRVLTDTLAVILQWSGFLVLSAYTTESAMEKAQKEKPDLLITDVIFKGEERTGIDVALFVRKALPSCKILLFSGDDASASLLAKAKAKGHQFEFLQKPVYPQEMLTKLGIQTLPTRGNGEAERMFRKRPVQAAIR